MLSPRGLGAGQGRSERFVFGGSKLQFCRQSGRGRGVVLDKAVNFFINIVSY